MRKGIILICASVLFFSEPLLGPGFPGLRAERRVRFNFRKFTSLRTGRGFRLLIFRAGRTLEIGRGRVIHLDSQTLVFRFKIRGRDTRGRVRLRYLRSLGKKILLSLEFRGKRKGRAVVLREKTLADAFLARNGILSFRYEGGKSFFQMARDSRGRNKIITNTGGAELRGL